MTVHTLETDTNPGEYIYYQELGAVVNSHLDKLTLIELIGGLECIKADLMEQVRENET